MLIEARFRRRTEVDSNIFKLNRSLLAHLSKIDGLWSGSKGVEDVYLDVSGGESATSDLSTCLSDGIKGFVSYASRLPAAIVDRAVSDDFLVLKLNTDCIDYHDFCNRIFAGTIQAFSPYRATIITDPDQDLDDFEYIVQDAQSTGKDVDGRDSVFRINAVNYFDELMCIKAFGLTATEIVKKLSTTIERAENLMDGVLLLASSKPVTGAELTSIDGYVKGVLR